MSPETIFQIHLVFGYVAWLLCFGVYILPRLKSMDRFEAQRAIATSTQLPVLWARLHPSRRRRPQSAR